MARKKIFEYKAKQILTEALDLPYGGHSVSEVNLDKVIAHLDNDIKYVLKVDQGVKGRMKKGLVKLNLSKDKIADALEDLTSKGFSTFLLEEMERISEGEERYLSLERVREGIKILYARNGGIEIESNKDIKEVVIPSDIAIPTKSGVAISKSEEIASSMNPRNDSLKILKEIDLPQEDLKKIVTTFEKYHFSFLEINPLIIRDSKFVILDSAVEVDSAGEFFARGVWSEDDFAVHNASGLTDEEKNVDMLAKKSQASFNLTVLDKNGSIFLLLSGGGASIVVADEAAALGFGDKIANYGEYSGNPNEEETYIYTKNLLSLMLKSQPKVDQPLADTSPKKVLILAGGVANFTDVKATFKGVIRALDDVKVEMADQGIKVFVRRGGPNQKAGLAQMKEFLEKNGLLGAVEGPDMVLTDIVGKAIQSLN